MGDKLQNYYTSTKLTKKVKDDDYFNKCLAFVENYVSNNNLLNLNQREVVPLSNNLKKFDYMRLFKINTIVFNDSKFNIEKLTRVYNSLYDIKSTVIFIINSDGKQVDLYLGVNSIDATPTCFGMLKKFFIGNFLGSKIEDLFVADNENLMTSIVSREKKHKNASKSVVSVSLVPSIIDNDDDIPNDVGNFQGIEQLINSMKGEKYSVIFIANPISKDKLHVRKNELLKFYSALSPLAKVQLSYGKNSSNSISNGISNNFSKTISSSISESNGNTTTDTDSYYNGSYSYGTSFARTVTEGESKTDGRSTTKTETESTGESESFTINYDNKFINDFMEKLDVKLKNIKKCEALGGWEQCAYFISQDIQSSLMASNMYRGIMCGSESDTELCTINYWKTEDGEKLDRVLEYLKYCNNPRFYIDTKIDKEKINTSSTYLVSSNDLARMMSLPNKSVSGVAVINKAEFCRNIITDSKLDLNIKNSMQENEISIGDILHMGELDGREVSLDINSLTSHCFITGSTGSGKSNTVYKLIYELNKKEVKFLIIEPAKGEYKKAFGKLDGMNIITTIPNEGRVLKINPFKFNSKIHILEHLDKLLEIFNACWPMYAAMPAVLKDAIEIAYVKCGWDLINSINLIEGNTLYPSFKDVLDSISIVIENSGFSPKTKSEYKGALKTRIRSLTNGLFGQIFCSDVQVNDYELFDENTIVDLSGVGSAESKALIMGILIIKLNEYRKANTICENEKLKHITVLEEAHNILKSNNQISSAEGVNIGAKSVELISNSIAEMRTYGEGFFIVDQSPTSVDSLAIKNTNTKIVMKLPDKTDCEIMGKSLALNENQTNEIAKLKTGEAIIMQNNWQEAVLTKVAKYNNNFYGDNQKILKTELLKLRGQVVEELRKQKINNIGDKEKLLNVFKNIDNNIMLDITNMIEYYFKNSDDILINNKLYKFLYNMIYAEKIFDIFKLDIDIEKYKVDSNLTNLDSKILDKWYQNIKSSMKHYIINDKESCYKYLAKSITIYWLYNNIQNRNVVKKFVKYIITI